MARFKIGDRVKIDCPRSELHGHTGKVWDICRWPNTQWNPEAYEGTGITRFTTAYRIQVDGYGKMWPWGGGYIGFPRWMLKPILPDKLADEFIERIKRIEREPIAEEILNPHGTAKEHS